MGKAPESSLDCGGRGGRFVGLRTVRAGKIAPEYAPYNRRGKQTHCAPYSALTTQRMEVLRCPRSGENTLWLGRQDGAMVGGARRHSRQPALFFLFLLGGQGLHLERTSRGRCRGGTVRVGCRVGAGHALPVVRPTSWTARPRGSNRQSHHRHDDSNRRGNSHALMRDASVEHTTLSPSVRKKLQKICTRRCGSKSRAWVASRRIWRHVLRAQWPITWTPG